MGGAGTSDPSAGSTGVDPTDRTAPGEPRGDGSDPGTPPPAPWPPPVTGERLPWPRGRLRGALGWLSGVRVARALVRAGLGLSGVRAVATLELSEAGVEATLAWRALGREHRRRRLTRPWSSVVAMRVRPARGALGYVVRGLPLLALVLGGLLLAGEGLRAGAALAVLVGAALVALGVAVDLLLDHRAARRRPAAELRLDAGPGLRLRLRVQDGARAEEVGREVARRRAAGPSAAADPPATARQGRAAG